MNEYDKGDKIRCRASFYLDGTLTDPAGIVFKFLDPDGTETSYTYGTDAELVKDSTGSYHVDVDGTTSGTWAYRWESTGGAQAADESEFYILRSVFS